MISKFALVALTATASVNALSLITPTDVRSATPLEFAWNFDNSDPLFSLELFHPSFRNDFALANNLDPASGGTRLIIPTVEPRDSQYVIRAVNVSNVNQEYARTGNFAVGDTLSTTGSASSTGSTSSATLPPSGPTTTGIPSNTNTGTSNTNTNTNTLNTNTNTNANTNTNTNTNTGSTTGTSDSGPTNTPQNGGGNGAISAGVNFAAVVFGAVAAAGLF
ncbi:hypothetical protein E1B28_002181 [Marasmius oreades]|uniref:Uncharacterized protein n=1 Tax=Marasmius oreades TaxID=181124 RepID=A0A9P7RN56_9AGAR|nr:uncharacterized protein E1B28_002181 [Marasmius oreades]KAG7086215.1 hypothetical protein E1B28_002181 [Marasmius oreades]